MNVNRIGERERHFNGRNSVVTYPLARTVAVTCVLGIIGVACNSDSDGFEPGAPIPTDGTVSSTDDIVVAPPAETPPASTDITTTTSTATTAVPESAATSTTHAADSSTTRTTEPEADLDPTAQAPGFDFPPADLETDPASPSNNRVVRPEDAPIIEAYLNAFEADMATFSQWPLDPRSPALLASPITDEVLSLYESGIARRTELNQVLDISGGLTSRPYVIEDDDGDPNRAIVWDCQIDATFWKDVDTGEKAPPDAYPNVGAPGVEFGWASALVFENGAWLVAEGGEEPRACD